MKAVVHLWQESVCVQCKKEIGASTTQVLLSGLGLSTPIPRQEDIGLDFLCSLSDQEDGAILTFGSPRMVSIKSASSPKMVLAPSKSDIEGNSTGHIEWLFRQELAS